METVQSTTFEYLPPVREVADLYILSAQTSASTGFCSLVARALRCRSCALLLFGPDGDVVANEAYGNAPGRAPEDRLTTTKPLAKSGVRLPLEASKSKQVRVRLPRNVECTGKAVSLTVELQGQVSGSITVADREDGALFTVADRELLERLTALYASSLVTQTSREASRMHDEIQSLRKQAIEAEENERQRLARELHDDVGHAITTAILSIDMIARQLPDDGVAVHALTAARGSLTECADCLNEFAFRLRPRILNDLGVAPALRGLARRVREACALDVSVETHGQERRLSPDTELAAFRVAQEAVTNALKHGQPTKISIQVTYSEDHLTVEVRDNGTGFDPATRRSEQKRYGQGLLGMRERAELVGGVLEIQSMKGLGTKISVQVPDSGGRR